MSPAKVDFGSVLCNQPVAARSVVIDSSPGPVGNWQATTAPPFAVAPSGLLVPGGKVSVGVRLSAPYTAPTPVTDRPLSLVNSGNDVANLVVIENGSLGLSFMPGAVSISPATTGTDPNEPDPGEEPVPPDLFDGTIASNGILVEVTAAP